MKLNGIWLMRAGAENDPHAKVEVHVQTETGWRLAITEPLDANFSHSVGLSAESVATWPLSSFEVEAQGDESGESVEPPRPAPELLPQIRRRFERALESAKNFKGMSAGSPKVMLEISDVDYLLKWLDAGASSLQLVSQPESESVEPKWQPIEMAPMDQDILLWGPDLGFFVGETPFERDDAAYEATDWMPLPDPPQG